MTRRSRSKPTKYRAIVRRSDARLDHDVVNRRALAGALVGRAKRLGLSHIALGKIIGDAPTRVSRLYHGHAGEFSVGTLLTFLWRLGATIEIKVTFPATRSLRARKPVVIAGR